MRLPFEPTTRWQGSTMGIGLRFMIVPTARAPHEVELTRRAQDAHAERPGERLGLPVRLGIERDPTEAALGDGEEERTDLCVGDVERDVDEPRLGRGFPETAVECLRNGGHCSLLRRRRTPEDAAWRAASSLEPSAVPMSE